MKELVQLLKTVIDRIPWPSEESRQAALDLLRKAEAALGIGTSVVGPTPGTTEPTAPPTPPPPPVPPQTTAAIKAAAEELLASGWTPPISPEPLGSPQTVNAFATTTPVGDAGS